MALLPEIAREEEYKIKERAAALVEKWRDMIVKEGGDEHGGDVTMADAEEKKEEPEKADPASTNTDEKKETNGDAHTETKPAEASSAPQTNGETVSAAAA